MKTLRAGAFAFIAFLIGGLPSMKAQATYTLAWNANPEPDIVGYRVHVGTTSRQYTHSYPTIAPSVLISDLPDGQTYFFAVTAMNAAGLESPFSEEISSTPEPSGSFLLPVLTSSALTLSVRTSPGGTVTFESSTDLQNWSFYTNRIANSQGVATLFQTKNSMLPTLIFRVRTL
jgi:hypothetical protein